MPPNALLYGGLVWEPRTKKAPDSHDRLGLVLCLSDQILAFGGEEVAFPMLSEELPIEEEFE